MKQPKYTYSPTPGITWILVASFIVNTVLFTSTVLSQALDKSSQPQILFDTFTAWQARFQVVANEEDRSQLIGEGVALARVRHAAMLKLIQTDPRTALQLAISSSARSQLPPQIATNLERDISGVGDLEVYCIDYAPGTGREPSPGECIKRFVSLNGEHFQAFVYGRRLEQTTKHGIPLQGIALDGLVAVQESVLTATKARQAASMQVGDKKIAFAPGTTFEEAEKLLEDTETSLGPEPGIRVADSSNGDGTLRITPAGSGSAWTTGNKRVIIIRVDFSDLPGDPEGLTASDVQNIQYGASLPAIYTQPRDQTITSGQNGFFQVQANGIPSPGYRWQRKPGGTGSWGYVTNNATYSGALTPNLIIDATTASMNGDLFQCVLTNSVGAVTTAPPAKLLVIPIGVTTLAGLAGSFGQADGTNTSARFGFPNAVAADGLGNVYVADRNNHTIRKVTSQGVVTTIAGLARSAGSNDGTNSAARFNMPYGIGMDSGGNLYVADAYNHTIRKLALAGTNWVVTTIAGRAGVAGHTDDVGTNALFYYPAYVAVDPATNIFIAEEGDSSVRQVRLSGTNWVVSTLCTNFVQVHSVCVDRTGAVFVPDDGANIIYRVLPDGTKIRIAGTGDMVYQDGPALQASFVEPYGIASDLLGNLYIVESHDNTIRCLSTNGMVSTVAGQRDVTGSSDGALTNASFNFPTGIGTDVYGNLYVADLSNDTIRKIVLAPPIQLPRLDGVVTVSNSLRVVLDGPATTNYYLLTSSDLANWSVRSTNVIPVSGWLTVQDPLTNSPGRFYRASTQLPVGLNR